MVRGDLDGDELPPDLLGFRLNPIDPNQGLVEIS
jgi:hypothetical protein